MCCGCLDGVLSVVASGVLFDNLQTSMPRMKALVGPLSMQRHSRSMGRSAKCCSRTAGMLDIHAHVRQSMCMSIIMHYVE